MQKSYSRAKLVGYIVEALQSGKNVPKLANQVAAYLIEAGKTSELDSVLRDAQELRAQQYGVVELSARSAHSLDQPQLAQVKQLAKQQYGQAKEVIIHQVQDDSAIGGINLTFPHSNLDLTVRAKLNQLKGSI